MPEHSISSGKPNYGIDAPGVIKMFALVAIAATLCGAAALWGLSSTVFAYLIAFPAFLIAAVCTLLACIMLTQSLHGKMRMRDAMLARLALQGHERVLDIGTGGGLLLIGAAQHLTTGKAVGIDIWRAEDQTSNHAETPLRNAHLAGVSDRVDVQTADARKLPFADASFDAVVSLLCIHNIEPAAEQALACAEIARVLKPGCRALLADYVPTHAYGRSMAAAGMVASPSIAYFLTALGPMWLAEAQKPLQPAKAA